ncbi:hypothetical protein Zmor_010046 [Zophobas morio]|uniref:Uncharacterized protein n=1 Tax=Zophobas morio TaxID=2755281 RepID=A0AA38MJI4_9CUCU|nr:hypothetical protein Zmor_010046 [Zophobas morio]
MELWERRKQRNRKLIFLRCGTLTTRFKVAGWGGRGQSRAALASRAFYFFQGRASGKARVRHVTAGAVKRSGRVKPLWSQVCVYD